ncbi:MAG: DNA repair protein RadA [Pseudomonadota bacterium]
MARFRTIFICQSCTYQSPKWLGRCPDCSAWNSFIEEVIQEGGTKESFDRSARKGSGSAPVPITSVGDDALERIHLGSEELNRVLGGGLTKSSVALLAGDPGIGKSTLLLQVVGQLAKNEKGPFLYISGEESAGQIKVRAKRLNAAHDQLLVLAETNLIEVLSHLEKLQPRVVVVDSVQTLYWPELNSIPGSISQVREVADRLIRFAKSSDTTVFLVGHVNKEGGIAGPMALEHLVDTVLFLEGDRGMPYRILRAIKNRFGATDEIGVFSMTESGMEEVANPSELFLRDRPHDTPGTVVFPAIEGSRPLLVEVQGLTSKAFYGIPLRNSVGFDKNRLTMLLAVLEKRAGVHLYDQDVYVNVVGGLRISEPAIDLAVVTAVLSSFLGKPVPPKTVAFGEIGLAGETRAVTQTDARLKEASKLGFSTAWVPRKPTDVRSDIRPQVIQSVDGLIQLLR